MKSLRTVYLTGLTILFYGLYNFMQYHLFIFPLPANDFIVLGIFLYLILVEKAARRDALFFGAYALLLLLQNPYNYELFITHEQIEFLVQKYFFEIFQVLTIAAFLAIVVRTYLRKREHRLSYLIVLAFGSYVCSLFFYDLWHNMLQLLAFGSLFAFHSIDTHQKPETEKVFFHQAFWLLLTIIRLSFVCTVYLNE
ncbi:MAG: hypothetical protein K0R65_287 [Crocinitomicaceae bacterium]|jgi:hypothetical protein|nr:hypothetical protein [Crocinitomicaceae bacterium]